MCSLKREGSCRCRKVFQSREEAWLEGPDVQCMRMSTELVSRVVESTETQKWEALSFCEQLGRKWTLWLKWILKFYWMGNQSKVRVCGKGKLLSKLGYLFFQSISPFPRLPTSIACFLLMSIRSSALKLCIVYCNPSQSEIPQTGIQADKKTE